MQINHVVDYTLEGEVAVLSLNNPPVNALGQAVRQGLKDGVAKAMADAAARAVLIICEGRTFIAGADITEFGGGPAEPGFHEVLGSMDEATKPIIAAIHGTALGGGLETALCCHYRVALASAKFGLPEVKLGILPGAGGTQRLPRVVGVEKALEMVTSGNPIDATEALNTGLVDRIIEGDLRTGGLAFAREVIANGATLKRVRDNDEKLQSAKNDPDVFSRFRKTIAAKTRGFIAPEFNIRCVEAAVNQPFDEGLKTEARLITELFQGPQSGAQQYFFFAERQAAKIPDIPRETPELAINRVGVIGSGTMGGGIAMNMVNVGIPVTMVEVKQEALDRGLGVIRKNYENSARKGRISEADVEQRMRLITGSLELGELADCDLIIEAVFEDMAVKKDIFTRLDAIARPGAILASNTSALDLNEIAAVTNRPESVIGLHFFSPANVMKLLEVVRGDRTSAEVIKTCMSLAKRINKTAVLVGVCHGFVGNRMLFLRQTQANQLALEGAAVEQIDKVLYDFGFPMGAFQMSDLAGLDIGWNAETSKGGSVKDCLCELNRLGQKNGAGFYDYDDNRRPTPTPIVTELFTEFAARAGISQRQIPDAEILERCVLPMINEGAKILEEGIAIRASDIDVVWVYGYGWPSYRGGPMHYANSLGLDQVVEKLNNYHQATGDDCFKPCDYLLEQARTGGRF